MNVQAAIVAICAALALIAATAVSAQPAAQDLAIRSTVPKFCTVGGSVRTIEFPITIAVGADGIADTAVQSFAVPSVICNTAADVTSISMLGGARAGGVARAKADAGVIDYIGTANFGGAVARFDTAGERATVGSTSNAARGTLVITITPLPPKSPLVPATRYHDVVRVMLAPR